MKQFFKFLFASLFGTFLALILMAAVTIGIIGAIASSTTSDKEVNVKDNSILYITLEEEVADRTSDDPFDNFDWNNFKSLPQIGLNDILENLDKAKKDDRIKGIFMDLTLVNLGLARMNEIRDAMVDFKTSGKFIYTYSDAMDQQAYYLASVSDKIYAHPGGILQLNGLSAQPVFLKGALDKLDIEMQVIRHGKFKSAIEPLTRENMSEANRLQTRVFVNSLWSTMVNEIAESRNLSADRINELADNLAVGSPQDAMTTGLIDGVKYRDEVLNELRELTEIEEGKDLNFVKIKKYTGAKVNGDDKSLEDYKTKIAVIYAAGEIQYGESESDVMGSKTIAEAIEKARKDEKVKSIVLRVNSPGGSSLASDIIWRQVVLAKKDKPVVVSMGNLAASGGYYISCGADKIIADENTITGSIGVFGIIPNAKGFFNNKLGVTFDTVNTNTYSDMGNGVRPLKNVETQYITNLVERIYDDFVNKVAEGRSMTYAEVDSVGQGRVWTGTDALEIGLVDEIGGLSRAIEVAAELAKIEKYSIYELPEQKSPFEDIAKQFSENMESKMAKKYFGEYFSDFNGIYKNLTEFGVYARMPYNYNIQ
ncbi:MAG TPA: signal peptide peptidase SppA [Flavobacteriales bacterium]|nr:signal peptide peptidase SppA [Flavobacteriales bacterium]